MKLKKFLVGQYDSETIVLENPVNNEQCLVSDDEFQVCKEILKNEKETLLNLLLPDSGVARGRRIEAIISAVRKLSQTGILDRQEVFSQPKIPPIPNPTEQKKKIQFTSLNALAAGLIGILEKVLAIGGALPFFLLVFGAAGYTAVFFPYGEVNLDSIAEQFSYVKLLLSVFFVCCCTLSFRTIIQAAFLKTQKVEARNAHFGFIACFPAILADFRSINLCGANAKLILAVIGMISPIAMAAIFVAGHSYHFFSLAEIYVWSSTCLGIALFLACPFVPFDGAEFLGILLLKRAFSKKLSDEVRFLFNRKKINGSLIVAMGISLIWLCGWIFGARLFFESYAMLLANDLISENIGLRVGAIVTSLAVFAGLSAPAVYLGIGLVGGKSRGKGKKHGPLSFEEQIAALQRIPMFSILNDQERLNLFNQMELMSFHDGQELVRQGEIGSEFLVLVRGQAKAFYSDGNGHEFNLADLIPGDAFGEIALIDDVPRTASVIANGTCHVLILKKEAFTNFVTTIGSPDRAKQMIRLSSFIRRHPLFNKLDTKSQAELIDMLQFRNAMPGEEILANVDGQDCFYILYSGNVALESEDDNGYPRLEPDDCFGYVTPVNYKYVADGGAGLLMLKIQEFQDLVWARFVKQPELLLQMER